MNQETMYGIAVQTISTQGVHKVAMIARLATPEN